MVNGLLSSAGQMPVDTRAWGEFVAKDLFGPSKLGKYHNPSTLHESDDGYEFICASVRNNGINHAMPKVDGENLSLTPPNIIAWGKQSPFFTYHENPCVTSQGMYFIEINDLTRNQIHFVITILNKLTRGYNYTNCLIGKKFDELSIPLPLKPGTDEVNYTEDDIDWNYMESYIHELEESYIHELEESYIQELDAYLKETGLDDYTLTDDEQALLEREPVFKEFKVGELFDKLNLKRIKPTFDKRSDLSKVQTEEFDLPLVNAKAGSNGIMYYGRSGDWESDTMTIDIVSNGAVSTGMVYTQPHATGVLWDAYLIKLKSDILSDVTVEHLLFLATTIQKSIQLKFNYSNKAVWAKVQHETIQLPVKPGTDEINYTEADIDWDYMTSHALVMEKQVIADVVDYKNEVIATTKKLVKK